MGIFGGNTEDKSYDWDGSEEISLATYYHTNPLYFVNITLSNGKINAHFETINPNTSADFGTGGGFQVGLRINGSKDYTDSWEFHISHNGKSTKDIPAIDVSEFDMPFTIQPVCEGCGTPWVFTGTTQTSGSDTYNHDSYVYNINKKITHTHVSTPAKPTIVSTTGTTITVKCTSTSDKQPASIKADTNDWKEVDKSSKQITFSGYSQGSTHTFKSRRYCGDDCPDKKYVVNNTEVTANTWKIEGATEKSTTKTLTFKAKHTAGTKGSSDGINYELYTNSSCTGTVVKSITKKNNNTAVIFEDLNSDTNYWCKMYSDGIEDNYIIVNGHTKKPPVAKNPEFGVSATTIAVTPNWVDEGSTGVSCEIKCFYRLDNSTSADVVVGVKNISNSGESVVFDKLTSGRLHYFILEYSNEDGTFYVSGIEADMYQTYSWHRTKKLTIDNINSSSQAIKVNGTSCNDNNIQTKVDDGSWSTFTGTLVSEANNVLSDYKSYSYSKTYNKLTHNKEYTITAQIKNCHPYKLENKKAVEDTSKNDSTITKKISTLELTASVGITEEHQHSLIWTAQAYVNGVQTDKDAIDNTEFKFITDGANKPKTMAVRENGYQNNAIESEKLTEDGNTTVNNYQTDKKVYSNNLTYYYCKYKVLVTISDGTNEATATATAHTTFPYIRIYGNDGKWHKAMPYAYNGTSWVPAAGFVYKGGTFKECNGE